MDVVLLTQSRSVAKNDRLLSDMSDLELLWLSTFGNPYEVAARILAIAAGGIGIWFYDGLIIGPIWCAAYLLALAVSFYVLRPADPTRPSALIAGVASHLLIAGVFAALPLYLITTDDRVLEFCGALALISLGAFNLLREEPPAIIQPIDIAIGWLAVAIAGATHIPGHTSVAAQLVMGVLCLALGGYYTLALITKRTVQCELRRAARQKRDSNEMEAVGRLAGGIAHDFNNILTVLQGSLELYHVVPQGPERDSLIEEARDAGRRATALVSHLLAFARRAPLDPRALEVGSVIAEAARHARALAPPGVAIDLREPPIPVHVMADADALHAALLSLLRNAGEAVGGLGTITLAVDLVQGPAEEANSAPAANPHEAHLRFSVADDGPGMDAEVAVRALEPFFTTKPVGKGAGMGLPMAKGFAEQSGGALRMHTSANGTTVSLHLPIAKSAL